MITCVGRLSFPSLFKATVSNLDPTGQPKFRTQFLFPLGTDMAPYQAALIEAGIKKWGLEKFNQIKGSFRNKALKAQGDKLFDQQGRPRPGYVAGAYFIDCSNKNPVGIVDNKRQPVIEERKVYGGVHARLEINPYAYEARNDKGIIVNQGLSWGVTNVQVLAYGDPFGFIQEDAEKVFTEMPGPDGTAGGAAPGGGAAAGQTAESLL